LAAPAPAVGEAGTGLRQFLEEDGGVFLLLLLLFSSPNHFVGQILLCIIHQLLTPSNWMIVVVLGG